MILIHTQNGVIETGGERFVYGSDFVKVYDKRDRLIGSYFWQNIVGVTDTGEAEGGKDARFNVQHPVTKEWRCFSTIVDDYVTDWMDEERYQRWRLEQYGKQAGEIRDANLMDYEEAEQIIADRIRWEAEEEAEGSEE